MSLNRLASKSHFGNWQPQNSPQRNKE